MLKSHFREWIPSWACGTEISTVPTIVSNSAFTNDSTKCTSLWFQPFISIPLQSLRLQVWSSFQDSHLKLCSWSQLQLCVEHDTSSIFSSVFLLNSLSQQGPSHVSINVIIISSLINTKQQQRNNRKPSLSFTSWSYILFTFLPFLIVKTLIYKPLTLNLSQISFDSHQYQNFNNYQGRYVPRSCHSAHAPYRHLLCINLSWSFVSSSQTLFLLPASCVWAPLFSSPSTLPLHNLSWHPSFLTQHRRHHSKTFWPNLSELLLFPITC